MELIWSQPGFKHCNEPLNIRNAYVQKYLGISDWQDLYSLQAVPKLKNYFQAFCDGRLHFKNPNPFSKYYRPITHRIVFKVIHGGWDRINWFRDTFNGRIVYLIRHPIAVSVSRKELPSLHALVHSDYQRHFSDEQLEYAERLLASGSRLEQAVLSWCLQNIVPLRQATDDWAVVSYEQLVLDPYPVIAYLADKLELPKPQRMFDRLIAPSGVKAKSDQETRQLLEKRDANKRHLLVEKWRREVDRSEEIKAMKVLEQFQLDAYTFGNTLPTDRLWIRSGVHVNDCQLSQQRHKPSNLRRHT